MELNDIYDENRNLTGKLHRRGTPWKPGEYGVVVCVWVYDHYCLFRRIPLKSIVLQPGETDNVMWASFGKVDWMIRTGKMCRIIGHQFYRQEKALRLRNMPKFGR